MTSHKPNDQTSRDPYLGVTLPHPLFLLLVLLSSALKTFNTFTTCDVFILLLVSICNPPCIIYFLIKGPHPSPPSPLWWCGRRRFPLRHWSLLGPGWQKDGPRHMGPVQRERWQEGKGEKTIGADAEHVPREAYRALDISLTHVHRGCRHRPAGTHL